MTMKPILLRTFIRATACLLLSGSVSLMLSAATDNSADAVLDRWVEASGGEKRIKAIRQSEYRLKMTLSSGLIIEAQNTVLAQGGYRNVMQTNAGEIVSADDGQQGWVHHDSFGGRVWEPAKAARLRRAAGPQEILTVRTAFPERRRLPDDEINGKKVHVIELAETTGWRERWYFSTTTGLRVRREALDDSQGMTIDYSDFRKVNGIVEPFRAQRREKSGNVSLLEVGGVAHATKVTVTRWALPEGLAEESTRIDEVLHRFQRSLGSKEATAKIKSRVSKSRLEVSSNGMSLTMHMSVRTPDRVLIEQNVPGMGQVLQGFDGTTGWAWSEMQGYRELRGAELAQLAATARIIPRIETDDTPLRRIVDEYTNPDGHRVLAVDLSTYVGSTGVCHFDWETGLLVKMETVLQTGPGSSFKALLELSDYREVDGVKIAWVQKVTNPAMRIVTTMLEVEHNRDLPDEIFLPRKKGEIPGGNKPTLGASTSVPDALGELSTPSPKTTPGDPASESPPAK